MTSKTKASSSTLALAGVFVLLSLTFISLLSSPTEAAYPSCQCITGWASASLNCSGSQQIVQDLQYFLSNNNCGLRCQTLDVSAPTKTAFQCQQAFSLLSQFHDYCYHFVLDESLFHYFEEFCAACTQSMNDLEDMYPACDGSLDCTDTTAMELSATTVYESCRDANCTDFCELAWLEAASYHRQCKRQSTNVFDVLFDAAVDSDSPCDMQCALNTNSNASVAASTVAECATSTAAVDQQYYEAFQSISDSGAAGMFDVVSLNYKCFLGLSTDDATQTVEICYDSSFNRSEGVVSHEKASAAESAAFFGEFGFSADLDQIWILVTAVLVLFMQLGFTLLEAGAIKAGNVQNILFKNLMDVCIAALVFYLFGYNMAFGNGDSSDANGFIGVEDITLESQAYNHWFFQFTYAAVATTIVSGAVAERCTVTAYLLFTIAMVGWIYPIVAHWVWSDTGFLSAYNADPDVYAGAIDFAGGGVVHMVGGISGLMGAICLGPRLRRFDASKEQKDEAIYAELKHQFEFGHNIPFQVLGCFILWFGWYAFTSGNTLGANGAMDVASKVCVTTTLSACSAGLTATCLSKLLTGYWSVPRVCNGILAGLVAITAGCAVVHPAFAILIGVCAGLLYYSTSLLVEWLKVDDPLDVFAVHGCNGMWGLLATGMFAFDNDIKFARYPEALYNTNQGKRFAAQLTEVVVIAAWVVVNSGLLFFAMRLLGFLRISKKVEKIGVDIFDHGGAAVHWGKVYSLKEYNSAKAKAEAAPDKSS